MRTCFDNPINKENQGKFDECISSNSPHSHQGTYKTEPHMQLENSHKIRKIMLMS